MTVLETSSSTHANNTIDWAEIKRVGERGEER